MKIFQSTRNKIYAGIATVLGLLLPMHFSYAWEFFNVSGMVTDLIVAILRLIELIFVGIAWLASFIMVLGSDLLLVAIKVTVIELKAHLDFAIINGLYDTMRNFANTFFIFILIYLAIKIILNMGEYKRLLTTLIISAVLVNFSYFYTTFIIDTSNIIATGFFNKIDLSQHDGSLGKYIITALEADKLDQDNGQPSEFNSAVASSATSSIAANAGDDSFFDDDERRQIYEAVARVLFSLLLIFFYAIAAYVFLDAAFLFLGRYVAFVFLIVLAPIAFASYPMPKMKERIWNKWFQHLTNQAFVAPIFMFFLYVIIQMLNVTQNGAGEWESSLKGTLLGGTTNPVVSVVLFFGIVIGLLQLALTTSREFAGEIGATVSKFGKMATGATAGAAAGAAAYGGKRTLGAVGAGMKSSGRLNQMATSNSRLARGVGKSLTGVGRTLSGSSFDLRSVPGVASAAGMGGISLGKAGTTGYDTYRKNRVEKITTLEKDRLDVLKKQGDRQKELEKMKEDGKTLTSAEKSELSSLSSTSFGKKQAKDATDVAVNNLKERSVQKASAVNPLGYVPGYQANSYEREAFKSIAKENTPSTSDKRKKAAEKQKDADYEKVETAKGDLAKAINENNVANIKTVMDSLTAKEKVSLGKENLLNKNVAMHIDHRDLGMLADQIAKGQANFTSNELKEFSKVVFGSGSRGNGFYMAGPDDGEHVLRNNSWRDSNPKGRIFD